MNANIADIIGTFVTGESWVAKDTSQRRPARNAVAQLAYYLYEVRGCQDGYDVEDWLRAEDLLAYGPLESYR
jgi:hypothetical protein